VLKAEHLKTPAEKDDTYIIKTLNTTKCFNDQIKQKAYCKNIRNYADRAITCDTAMIANLKAQCKIHSFYITVLTSTSKPYRHFSGVAFGHFYRCIGSPRRKPISSSSFLQLSYVQLAADKDVVFCSIFWKHAYCFWKEKLRRNWEVLVLQHRLRGAEVHVRCTTEKMPRKWFQPAPRITVKLVLQIASSL